MVDEEGPEPISGRPAVAHQVGTYLRSTENWIHQQIRFAAHVRAVVLAKRTENVDRFAIDSLYALRRLPTAERLWNSAAGAVLGYQPFFLKTCRTEGVRLIHAHFGLRGTKALGLARALDVPLVTSFYGADMYVHPKGVEGLRRRYGSLFARGQAFLVEGPAARARLLHLGCPPEKVHTHRLGVDLHAIRFIERQRERGSPLDVLIAARFEEKKGLPYAVEGFCRVARADPRLRLTVVGGARRSGAGRSIERDLHETVERFGVADRVRFTGFLPWSEMHALATQHDVFLHPSVTARDGDAEGGHPVVLTEMAASGMPIISTRHCDIGEVVVQGETGWLCGERSAAEVAAALEEALEEPERLTAYGRAARRLVERRYDVRKHTMDRIYGPLLDGSRR